MTSTLLRPLLTLSAFSLLGIASAAHAQAACDPETFEESCQGDGVVICATTDEDGNPVAPITRTIDCTFPNEAGTPELPNATCGAPNCEGSGCSLLGVDCLSGQGDPCLGILALVNDDTTDDNRAFALGCQDGLSCVLTSPEVGEVCAPAVGPACEQSSITCNGNVLTLCLSGTEDENENGVLDAGEDDDGDGALDELVLVDPVAIDCAGFGGTCDATATQGPLHAALNDTAAAPDCVILVDAGEGEGEGEDACSSDEECDRGETCDDGQCVGGDDKAEDDKEEAPSCASAAGLGGAAPLFALLFAALLPRRRRS